MLLLGIFNMTNHTKALLEKRPFIPLAYQNLHENVKDWLTQEIYTQAQSWFDQIDDMQLSTITYITTDGLSVNGILATPQPLEHKKYPVIIFNRGGANGEGVTITGIKDRIYPFVKAGYIVIASHYRDALGSEGIDELGGADIYDVLALFDVIKELPYADIDTIFMLGFSRGGMMTYIALSYGVRVKAAATMAGVTDLFMFEEQRPDAIPLLESMIPHYKTDHSAELTKRSATRWAEKINTPLLLLHGESDTIISIQESEKLVSELEKYKKPYKFIRYSGCNHFFDGFLEKAHHEILKWFEAHSTKKEAQTKDNHVKK